MLAVGMAGSAANAATLGLRWKEAPTQQKLSVFPSQQAAVEVVVTLLPGEILSALGFQNQRVANDNLWQTGAEVKAPNWEVIAAAVTNAQLGLNNQFVGWGALGTGENNLAGPGTFVIGNYFVHFAADDGAPNKEIVFNMGDSTAGGTGGFATVGNNPLPAVVFLNEAGGDYNWDARWNVAGRPTVSASDVYVGYVAFGNWGSPGWTLKKATGKEQVGGGQARNPLLLDKAPEPATLALLGLGGLALIRRRRAA
jgi:hypothetical protein